MTTSTNQISDLDLDVAARLRTAVTRLHRRLRQESHGILTPSQGSALAMIARLESPTLGALARAEQMQPPTMTRIIAGLEDLGLVKREVDQTDRRVARMALTPKGARELDRMRNSKTAFIVGRLESLSLKDREQAEQLVRLLETIEATE